MTLTILLVAGPFELGQRSMCGSKRSGIHGAFERVGAVCVLFFCIYFIIIYYTISYYYPKCAKERPRARSLSCFLFCRKECVMTKVIAINGSPRKDGNTAILIKHVLGELENEDVETELV